MEEEGISAVLARAFELRSKITNCINKATAAPHSATLPPDEDREAEEEDGAHNPGSRSPARAGDADDEGAETLLSISDALESLEAQLSSLQALQQQQLYEREAALAEIDYSRKILLVKLKEYKGQDLDVIHEASAFASETVEHNNDLLLPPYPSRPPQSMMLNNDYFPTTHKLARNGTVTGDPTNEAKKKLGELKRDERPAASGNALKQFGHLITAVAKTVVTLVGVVSVLNLAGFEPWLRKRGTHLKVLGVLRQPATEGRRSTAQCPPGKVLVVEDGEARCLVKERVEIPLESLVAKPDVNYGFG